MLDGRGSSKTYSIDHDSSICTPRSMDASTSANAGNGRYQQHRAADLPQQQYAAAVPVPVPVAAIPVATAIPYSSSSHQLRPPPVRYASSSAGTLPQHSHLKRTGRGYPADEATCTCVLPRTSVLCRLLVVMSVLLVCVQAVSCGMFFCVRLPIIHSRGPFVEYQDLVADFSQPALSAMKQPAAQQTLQQPVSAVPKLIPRVIHQTYSNGRMPASAKSFMKSWAEVNGETWQVRFYSDDAAMTFVRREFPEYFEAYLHLPKDVERADFFRYMVVLRLGGAYADVDAECRQPLDSIIQPADTMLVGWDTEVSNATSAAATGLARQRLVANWFFVASAGHPVLRDLCDHIARNAMNTFSNNTVRDTAERTGQAVWTDVVLRHALQHHTAKHDDPWKVRILPRVAFGVRPMGDEPSMRPDSPGVVVLHHFMSSWQTARRRSLIQVLLSRDRPTRMQEMVEPVLASNITHYPVSIAFDPPFIFMTDLVGLGDVQAAADVSATITAHGTWQPGIDPNRKPSVVEALVGALAKHSQRSTNTSSGGASHTAAPPANDAAADAVASGTVVAAANAATTQAGAAAEQAGRAAAGDSSAHVTGTSSSSSSRRLGNGQGHGTAAAAMQLRGGVLVDVGAGQGFFSLAAAARGHRVIAFEASPASLAAFKASVRYNGFQDLVTVHSTTVGASSAAVCLQQTNRPGCPATAAAAKLAGLTQSRHGNDTRGGDRQHVQQEVQAAVADMQLRRRRGYPWVADGADLPPTHPCCRAIGRRVRLSDVLQNTTDVAALRISAHGHEAFVLQGALDYLRDVHKPDVVYVEFWPASLKAAGYQQPRALLDLLFGLGYTNIAHAGRVCDARWQNATQDLHLQSSYSSTAQKVLRQPTWCKLRPEQFNVLADAADASVPENVMFLLGQHDSAPQPSSLPVDGKYGSGSRSSSRSDSSGTDHMSGSTNPGMTAHGGVGDSAAAVGQDSSSDADVGTTPVAELQQAVAGPGIAADPQRSEQVAPPPSLVLAGSTGISADLQKPL